MTPVPDIMQITSTAEDVSELFESTQRDDATTEQNNSDDDTSIHTDVVTQQGSLEGDAVTSSSTLVDSSKLQTDSSKEEESTVTPTRSTRRILSTTEVRDEPSTSNLTPSTSPDGVISTTTDRSDLKSSATLVSTNDVTSTDSSTEPASTGLRQSSQQSTDAVSLIPEESTTPPDEPDPGLETSSKVPVSSHLTEHRSLILDSQSVDSYASTQTRKESGASTSTSTTRQHTWKTSTAASSSSTFQPSMVISTEDEVSGSVEGTKGGSGAVGYAVGATVSCLLLIVIIISILFIYRKARKKTHGFADQDVTDYRSLVKSPTKRQDKDGSSAPFEAFPSLPIEGIREEEIANDIPLSASNFRAPHFEAQLNGSKQKETPESAKEIPMEDISETCARNSESYFFNSFKPSHPNTTEIQYESSSEV